MALGPTARVPEGEAPTLRLERDPRAGTVELEVARESIRAGLFPSLGQPRMLGRYRLVRRIGDGGMGLILQAYDPQLDRELAIKIVRGQTSSEDGGEQQRLLAEARTAARLSHPNVVTVYDVGLHDGRVFVAMELVRGPSLRKWILQKHSVAEVLHVMQQAGRGLMAAHAAGLVHRDFKPGNVLVGDDGRARVVDFGLARSNAARLDESGSVADEASVLSTASGLVAGTPAYMAPEQWIGGVTDARTDQFSFCLCLYEALFGARPFGGTTIAEIRNGVLNAPLRVPSRPGGSPALRDVLERGLARRKEDRFEDMAALLEELAACSPEPLARVPQEERCAPGLGNVSRCEAYLAGLPRGLDSHPACLVDGGLVRLALTRRPIEHELVGSFEHLARSEGARWIPEVVARALMAAIHDVHFESAEAHAAFVHQLIRARMTSAFLGFLLPKAGSTRAAEAIPRVWRALHRGTAIAVETLEPGAASVELEHPPGLLDELGRIELEQTIRVAMERAGARIVETHLTDLTQERVRLRTRWG